jgi:hypothetical protein
MRIHVIDAILSRNGREKRHVRNRSVRSTPPEYQGTGTPQDYLQSVATIPSKHSAQLCGAVAKIYRSSGRNLKVRAAQSRFVRGRSTVNTRGQKHLLPHASSGSLLPRCSLSRAAPITRVAVNCSRIPVVLGGSWMSCVPILQAASFTG